MADKISAAAVIAALEKGYCVATGAPDHVEYLRLEEYSNGAKKLECYGWGSACGSAVHRLESIVYHPYRWVVIHVKEYDRVRFERIANRQLKKRGQFECGDHRQWQWKAETEQSK